jgi:hypothetical protein
MEAKDHQEWENYIKHYETSKGTLPWKAPPPVERVRHADIKDRETRYNPILQCFNDPTTVNYI